MDKITVTNHMKHQSKNVFVITFFWLYDHIKAGRSKLETPRLYVSEGSLLSIFFKCLINFILQASLKIGFMEYFLSLRFTIIRNLSKINLRLS